MFPVSDILGLAEGAYSRAEGDWLLGLNLTRAATLSFAPPLGAGAEASSSSPSSPKASTKASTKKGFWSIGRVQTPILSLICERDESIENFKPRTFYQVKATFQGDAPFEATLLVPSGMTPFAEDDNLEVESDSVSGSDSKKEHKSFITSEDADVVLQRILATRPQAWKVVHTTKKSTENPPNLFSLTSLQKWCNKNWGWEAKRTLDAAQAAYEVDKSLTYPRTDASFLPKDSVEKMDSVYRTILSDYLEPLNYDVASCSFTPSQSPRSSHIFDDSKLTDHYAIVPTGVIPKDLTSDSSKVWLAVVRRFLTSFSSPALVSTLVRRLTLGVDCAVTSGKTYEDFGWIDLDNRLARLTEHDPKPPLGLLPNCGDLAPLLEARIHQGKTTPSKPFTEATLLSLMENIHTKFEDSEDDLKEAIGAKGIGTPATRASIIELLIARAYIERQKKGSTTYLRATGDGRTLISNLRTMNLEILTHAQLTAEWESKLNDMEKAQGATRVDFLNGICTVVDRCINTLRSNQSPLARQKGGYEQSQPKDLDLACPFSGKPIQDLGNFWRFPHFPEYRFYKTIAGRFMDVAEYIDVLRNNAQTLQGFTSSKGKKFSAKLSFDSADGKFKFEFDNTTGFQGEETKQKCPNTGEAIVDKGKFWSFPGLENRFWKEVSGRKMKLTDYIELVKTGRTGFFENFKSKAGNPFTAALVLENSNVKFEFSNSNSSAASMNKNMGMKGPGVKAKSTR
jgi:DNA topoisomerase-3